MAVETFPAGSVTVAVTGPEACCVGEVTLKLPLAGTVVEAVVPSGKVTFTVEPGSPVPEAVIVPFGFPVVESVGAVGAVVSRKGDVAAVEIFPAGSVAVALMGPED